MISKNHILATEELRQFSHKCLLDDRQDYIVEVLNKIVENDENKTEDRILALYNLGEIYWHCIGDLDRALQYINQAFELSHNTNESFNHVLRGNVWKTKLDLLELLGRQKEIDAELHSIISKYSAEGCSNSLLYYAYLYRADFEYKNANYDAALENLNLAKTYHPTKYYADKLHVVESTDGKKEFDKQRLLLSKNTCTIKDWKI